ncbi:hypothetical protein [Algoriphagus sp.]|uniref:hypothetical protein n=1 Tax=Algoriphagus sp. TaxID=1872435 RepID=UPI00391A0B1A
MNIDIDFSELYHGRGDYPDKISQKEILTVYSNPNWRLWELDEFPKDQMFHLACGYSISKRILLIAAKFDDNRIKILQVKVAGEIDIENYFCRQ